LAHESAVDAFRLESTVLPRWSAWIAVVGVIANPAAVLGMLALTGPLNSGNGLVGGIAAPLGLYLLWIFSISVWWLRQPPPLETGSSSVSLPGVVGPPR
jgi:hypothetical protein